MPIHRPSTHSESWESAPVSSTGRGCCPQMRPQRRDLPGGGEDWKRPILRSRVLSREDSDSRQPEALPGTQTGQTTCGGDRQSGGRKAEATSAQMASELPCQPLPVLRSRRCLAALEGKLFFL